MHDAGKHCQAQLEATDADALQSTHSQAAVMLRNAGTASITFARLDVANYVFAA
jgi:hypothetical protein